MLRLTPGLNYTELRFATRSVSRAASGCSWSVSRLPARAPRSSASRPSSCDRGRAAQEVARIRTGQYLHLACSEPGFAFGCPSLRSRQMHRLLRPILLRRRRGACSRLDRPRLPCRSRRKEERRHQDTRSAWLSRHPGHGSPWLLRSPPGRSIQESGRSRKYRIFGILPFERAARPALRG